MKRTLTILLLIGMPFLAFSQEEIADEPAPAAGLLQAAVELPKDGTYQIIVQGSQEEPAILSDFLLQVNIQRKLDVDTTIPVTGNISIFVPSIMKIRAQDFQPLEKYKFIN